MPRGAVGFRAHTGWAAAVVIAGPASEPTVIDRRRVNLLERGIPWECYHAAMALPRPKAEALIEKARSTATELAMNALRDIASICELTAVGVVLSNARPLLTIDQALSSHAMQHAAEGQLYRQAIIDAADGLGPRVSAVPERDLADAASAALDLTPAVLRGLVGDLGRDIGPPWAADQKAAALAALLALSAGPARRRRRANAGA